MWRFILSLKLRENRKRGKHLVVGSGTDMNGKLGSIPASVAVPEVRMLLFSHLLTTGAQSVVGLDFLPFFIPLIICLSCSFGEGSVQRDGYWALDSGTPTGRFTHSINLYRCLYSIRRTILYRRVSESLYCLHWGCALFLGRECGVGSAPLCLSTASMVLGSLN
jgi:hypothetical protein